MVAGIDHARGRVLITMDADLQNDPADIPNLLAKIAEGYDLVVGVRRNRQDKWLSRRLPSVIANRLIAWVTGVRITDNGCTLKAYRAGLIKSTPLYSEMHRFIPAITSTAGARITEIEVRHHPRRHGTSKYGLSRVFRVCFDLVIIATLLGFSRKPLFCFLWSALAAAVLCLISFGLALSQAAALTASAMVFTGVSVLWGSLAIFLGLAGVIVALIGGGRPDRLVPGERSGAAPVGGGAFEGGGVA